MLFFFFDNDEFEKITFEILEKYSKRIERDYKQVCSDGSVEFDGLIISNRGYKALFDVKVYSDLYTPVDLIKNAARQLAKKALSTHINNLVIITSTITEQSFKDLIFITYGVNIIDVRNLIFLAENRTELHSKLMNLLSRMYVEKDDIGSTKFSFNDIFKDKTTAHLLNQQSLFQKPDESDIIIHELEAIPLGKGGFRLYEDACTNALEYLFHEKLSGWYRQEKTEDDLNAFDMICRLTSDRGVWGFFGKYLNSQYIVFEYKNYSNPITQKEIYTTEKYLFRTALRTVAIVISRQGTNKNAIKASHGILREQGKLILSLTNADLIEMIQEKKRGTDPSEYLFKRVDEIFLHLSK